MARAKFEIWADCGTVCPRCSEALVSPDWSEFVCEGLVLNLWSCTRCGDRFETEAHTPADAEPRMTDRDWALVFPPMLVA
jgi:DNA-directed RNA polymerase subunit RPC12/RpoP